MLKTNKHFKGVISHFDFLPSAYSLFEKNFDVKIDPLQHYLGMGLDTSLSYRSKRFIPIDVFKKEFPNIVYKDYVLLNDEVYKFKDGFRFEIVSEQEQVDIVKNLYMDYLMVNEYVMKSDRIWYNVKGDSCSQ